jgi:hypothetical protein
MRASPGFAEASLSPERGFLAQASLPEHDVDAAVMAATTLQASSRDMRESRELLSKDKSGAAPSGVYTRHMLLQQHACRHLTGSMHRINC